MAGRNRTQLRAPYDTTADNLPNPQRQNKAPEYNNRYSSPHANEVRSRGASRNPSRLDLLEERLVQQEKNSQGFIERAFKSKDDVINSLNFTQGTWQEEKHARAMLQEHISSITAVVNRLNSDIANLEETVRTRDSATLGTNTAVKNLEVHHVATLTDLRGRIVRCDTSIAKLSQEIRQCFDTIKQATKGQQDQQDRFVDRIHELESKIVSLSGSLDRNTGEQNMKLQHLEGDSQQQMSQLDVKTQQVVEDLRHNINTLQMYTTAEREKFEAKLIAALENNVQIRDQFVEKLERKLDETQFLFDQRMQKLEEMIATEGERLTEMQKNIETKVVLRLDSSLHQQHEEIAKVKRDTRDGFSTVHESISNMKTVIEGKQKLLEDQLRKEISQIRKMVVLV